ncbi:hypothetical protein FKM82_005811 [Ascaphus truei]
MTWVAALLADLCPAIAACPFRFLVLPHGAPHGWGRPHHLMRATRPRMRDRVDLVRSTTPARQPDLVRSYDLVRSHGLGHHPLRA